MESVRTWLLESWTMFGMMAPYLLLGFFLAGMLRAFVPDGMVAKYLGGRGILSVFNGSLVGVPLPLCSCGVIPFADLLKRQGASKGAITSFLISTPQTGVDSILATYAILGLPIALWKVATALVSGVVGGLLTSAFTKNDAEASLAEKHDLHVGACTDGCTVEQSEPFLQRLKGGMSYGFGMLVEEIAFWLVVGTLVAGAIGAFVPDDMLVGMISDPYLRMMSVLIVAVPLYVCATGSIPVAAALVMKGLPVGGAIVFLIAGPATNVATLSVFTKVLGKKTVAVYLSTIVVLSLASGMLFELLFPDATLPVAAAISGNAGDASLNRWMESIFGVSLAVLVVRALLVKAGERFGARTGVKGVKPMPDFVMQVQGMTCKHCSMTVENALKGLPGVDGVQVDLETGKVSVQGSGFSIDKLVQAVEAKGYKVLPGNP